MPSLIHYHSTIMSSVILSVKTTGLNDLEFLFSTYKR